MDQVTLREHLEMKLDYERQLVDLRAELSAGALELQGLEYERRLKDLNHEAARVQAAVSANVSSDTWEAFVATYRDDQKRLVARFDVLEQSRNKMLGGFALAVVIIPAITALVVYLLTRHGIPTGTAR